jgi:hypothetical protein
MTEMYEILFACPAVEAITTWSAADGGWLNAPGGFLRGDNSVKPAYTALNDKIHGEWWTRESLVTDDRGELTLEGFRGDYELCWENGKTPFRLDGKEAEIELVLD